MARNAIESDFRSSKMAQKGIPKWRPAAILEKKFKKKRVAYWSEMARNAIESDFRSSKMAQKGLPKWRPAAILKKNSKK